LQELLDHVQFGMKRNSLHFGVKLIIFFLETNLTAAAISIFIVIYEWIYWIKNDQLAGSDLNLQMLAVFYLVGKGRQHLHKTGSVNQWLFTHAMLLWKRRKQKQDASEKGLCHQG